MYFNRRLIVASFLSVAVLLTGCARENETYDKVMYIKGDQECLSTAPLQIERYIHGISNEGEIRGFWSCLGNSLKLFKKFVKGEVPGSYKPSEIKNFLRMYFLGTTDVPDALLEEIMVVKGLMIGGAKESLTHTELEEALELFDRLADYTVELAPHIRWISGYGNAGQHATPEQIDAANEALRTVLARFGDMIAKQNKSYSFSNLKRLLEELSGLFVRSNPQTTLQSLKDFAPMIARLKSILVGQDLTQIKNTEWRATFDTLAQFYGIWIRYRQAFDTHYWYSFRSMEQISKVIDQIRQLLEQGLNTRPSKKIESAEIESLITDIDGAMEFPGSFHVDTMISVWRFINEDIIGDGIPNGTAIGKPKLDLLFGEIRRWEVPQLDYAKTLAQPKPFATFLKELQDKVNIVGMNTTFGELLRIFQGSPFTFAINEISEMMSMYKATNMELFAFSRVNWEKALIRQLIRALAKDPVRRDRVLGVTKDELKDGYMKIKPILVALKVVEPTNDTFYTRIHLEGSVFMPHSDGKELLTYEEAVGYIHFVLSGMEQSNFFREQIKNSPSVCPDPTLIGVDCLLPVVKANLELFFSEMPALKDYFKKLNDKDQREFVQKWLKIFDKTGIIPDKKLLEAGVVLHYLETFMARFDENKDGFINVDEAIRLAYPIFGQTIRDLLGLGVFDTQEEQLGFFTYILAYGEAPDPSLDPVHEIRFRHWVQFPQKWSLKADRKTLLAVLAALSGFTN